MSDLYVGDNRWIPSSESNADSERLVWSTKNINELLLALDKGYRPKVATPFYEGKQFLKKGNIVFEYTPEEIAELAKCANDIVYFAEKYAVVMTDEGVQQVKLRDYQKQLLRDFQNNRFNVVLASRQMGKCTFYNTNIIIREPQGTFKTTTIGDLYYNTLKDIRPLKVTEWLKYGLWKLYAWVDRV